MLQRQRKRAQRHKRVRAKIKGTNAVPRLCVFCSNKHTYAQLIDDTKGVVVSSVGGDDIRKLKPEEKKEKSGAKTAKAYMAGLLIAKMAREKNISRVVFDRGGFKYHGRVKSLAEGAREGGLRF